MKTEQIGKYAFLIGILIAVVLGFVTSYASILMMILVVLGLIVGFLHIPEKKSTNFLIAAITLIVGGVAGLEVITVLGVITTYITAIIGNIIAFVSAAALVVALKTVVQLAK